MKTLTITLLVLILVLSACATSSPENTNNLSENLELESHISDTCPRGIHDDPAPGMCPLYIDENSDGFCDYG